MDEASIYLEHQSLIRWFVRRLCHQYPVLDFDELHGEATIWALEAIRTYDPVKSKMGTWITRSIHMKVTQNIHQRHQWTERLSRSGFPVCPIEMPDHDHFNLLELVNEVSDDAALVISQVVSNDLTRGVLREFLTEFGWSKQKIQKVFDEIREAL